MNLVEDSALGPGWRAERPSGIIDTRLSGGLARMRNACTLPERNKADQAKFFALQHETQTS